VAAQVVGLGVFSGSDFGDVIPGLTENALWTKKTGARTKLGIAKTGLGRRIGDSARSMAYNAKHKAITGVKKMPKKAGRFVRRAGIGALAGGAAGLAASVTDPSKVFQNAAMGAGIGARLGTGVVSNADRYDALTPEGYKDVAERAGYKTDDEYKQAKQEKYVKDYKKNARNRFELERNFGNTESKRILKEDMGTFLDNGVTDIKDIVTIEKMVQDKKVGHIEEGIATRKYAKRTGDTTDMTAKKRDEWKNTFAQEYGKKEKFKDQDHGQMADSVLDRIDAYYKTKKTI